MATPTLSDLNLCVARLLGSEIQDTDINDDWTKKLRKYLTSTKYEFDCDLNTLKFTDLCLQANSSKTVGATYIIQGLLDTMTPPPVEKPVEESVSPSKKIVGNNHFLNSTVNSTVQV